jgi:hypothetical protein
VGDFLLALGITVGGGLVMSKMDNSRAYSMQQQSCAQQGGQYSTTNGTCYKGTQLLSPSYTMWGPTVDLGVPVAGALLATRSLRWLDRHGPRRGWTVLRFDIGDPLMKDHLTCRHLGILGAVTPGPRRQSQGRTNVCH